MSPSDLILDVLIPAVVSAIILLAAWRPWTRSEVHGRWGAPIALAGGFAAVFPRITGAMPHFLPIAAPGCIFYVAIAVGLLGLIVALIKLPIWMEMIGMAAIMAVSLGLLLNNQLKNTEQRNFLIGAIVVMTIVATLWWLAFETVDESRFTLPAAMLLESAAVGLLGIMSGTFVMGLLGLAIAGAVAPLMVMAIFCRPFSAKGSAMTLTVISFTLLAASRFYADLTWLNFILLALAPLLLFVDKLWILAKRRPMIRATILLGLIFLPLISAIALATPEFIRTMREEQNTADE